jgi:hypothetical protein
MNDELSRYLAEALPRAALSATKADQVQRKLLAVAIDPFLVSLPLDSVRVLRREGHATTIDFLIRHMTLSQLRKASKAWDKHFKISTDKTLHDVRTHVERLAQGRVEPAAGAARRAVPQPRRAA